MADRQNRVIRCLIKGDHTPIKLLVPTECDVDNLKQFIHHSGKYGPLRRTLNIPTGTSRDTSGSIHGPLSPSTRFPLGLKRHPNFYSPTHHFQKGLCSMALCRFLPLPFFDLRRRTLSILFIELAE